MLLFINYYKTFIIMKKITLFILVLLLGMGSMIAQMREQSPVSVESSRSTDALFDLLYTIDIGATGATGANGNAGIIFFNDQYWVSAWASDLIHILDASGVFVETISITGIVGTRSLTTDGTMIYIGTAGSQIFEVDPVTKTLVSTISITTTSDAAARMCAYDPTLDGGAGGFWIGNFGSDIASVSMTGAELSVIAAAVHGTAIYGGVIDNVSPGGPFLWIHNQGTSQDLITQLDPGTGVPTGVEYDFLTDGTNAGAATVLAGGLFLSDAVHPSTVALVGVSQCSPSDLIFAVELTSSIGVNDNEIANFSLYPNPVSDVLNLKADVNIDTVSIFNMLGQEVINTTKTAIDMSNLPAGSYIVKVKAGQQFGSYNLVKQ